MPRSSGMTTALCAVFLLSGASALIFENLWFRQAGLAFGTTVWASSLVLSGFMGGMALGNAWVARTGSLAARPVRVYALLEAAVGVSGVAIVSGLPGMPGLLAPLFGSLLGEPLALNALRFGVAFALLLVPSTAMGATLPLLVKALHRHRPGFGTALGWLYGWNTLGATLGAITVEQWLVPALGVRGSAWVAGACNALAVALCLTLLRPLDRPLAAEPPGVRPVRIDAQRLRVLATSALCGAALLALEVVWFRFLQLFVHSTTRSFAIMLMVVLLGIGCGGLVAGWWLRARPAAWKLTGALALVSGMWVVTAYRGFHLVAPPPGAGALVGFGDVVRLSLWLMLPVAGLSGVLFTFVGRGAFESWGEETRTTGWVTMANTLGAMLGALAAAWWMLPRFGIEGSFFALALAYGGVACLAPLDWARALSRPLRRGAAAFVALYGLALLAFPFGAMRERIVPDVVSRWLDPDTSLATVREGLNETIAYLERRRLGLVAEHQLVTNSYSMASTSLPDKRYMSHFVYWPLAFRPEVRKALLISYGVGVTAGALVDSREIERIDVVDISPEIVEMNRIVYPDPDRYPPDDPRVHVIVEDGRFYLLVSRERYDLITAEPPPLGVAGVVNLYTREYFGLLRDRLNPGGTVTYWLPVGLLSESDARHVIRAFCDVFEDCSLWRGVRWEWMLAGSREGGEAVSRRRFERQWRDPRVREQLRVLGFEAPELLITTFLGDADFLRALTADATPLVDDRPARISNGGPRGFPLFSRIAAADAVAARLSSSAWLRTAAPAELVDAAVAAFPAYAEVEQLWLEGPRGAHVPPWRRLDRLLSGERYSTFVQWHLGDGLEHTGAVERLAAAPATRQAVEPFLAIRALARGENERAARLLSAVRSRGFDAPKVYYVEMLADAYGGDVERARRVAAELAAVHPEAETDPAFWALMSERFGIENPYAAQRGAAE